MKRQIFLVILLAFLIIPGAAMADSYMGFSYTILEDNTAEIISGPRAQNEVVIPSEINGHQVTSIRSVGSSYENDHNPGKRDFHRRRRKSV